MARRSFKSDDGKGRAILAMLHTIPPAGNLSEVERSGAANCDAMGPGRE
jgi:hypothetical protein